jgi:hypothetical protein
MTGIKEAKKLMEKYLKDLEWYSITDVAVKVNSH